MRYLARIAAGAAVAVLSLFGVSAAGASTTLAHPNSTAQCVSTGGPCIDGYSQLYGNQNVINGANSGKVTLRLNSNGFSNEDVVLDWFGTVRQAVHDGLLTKNSYANVNYPNFFAGELEFSPFGRASHKCIGLPGPATAGQKVIKVPCGTVNTTIWVWDHSHGTGGNCLTGHGIITGVYCPLINASDQNFSTPQALTTFGPNTQLQVRPENNNGQETTPEQQWSFRVNSTF